MKEQIYFCKGFRKKLYKIGFSSSIFSKFVVKYMIYYAIIGSLCIVAEKIQGQKLRKTFWKREVYRLDNRFMRNEMLIGQDGANRLHQAKVIVFGIGGVGAACVESLARSGIGHLTLVDSDRVDITNLNRQLLATEDAVGKLKTEVMQERILSLNPHCSVTTINTFYLPENAQEIDLSGYDYIVDAIDTVSAKIELILRAKEGNIPIISCMGTGNKLHPEKLTITDIYKTKVCPLCRVMRRELKNRGIEHLTVVYSEEEPIKPKFQPADADGRNVPGSMPFVPPVAGFYIASKVVTDILEIGGTS